MNRRQSSGEFWFEMFIDATLLFALDGMLLLLAFEAVYLALYSISGLHLQGVAAIIVLGLSLFLIQFSIEYLLNNWLEYRFLNWLDKNDYPWIYSKSHGIVAVQGHHSAWESLTIEQLEGIVNHAPKSHNCYSRAKKYLSQKVD